MEDRCYNFCAKASDCTLLPDCDRGKFIWSIPSAKYTRAYGFGQSMVWYPTELEAEVFLSCLIKNIENYRDENWLNKHPE